MATIKPKKYWITMIALIIISGTSLTLMIFFKNNESSDKGKINDEPILISSNSDFERLKFPGKGTKEDPFRIENLKINATGLQAVGIFIKYTDTYFVIQDCHITTDYIGIQILQIGKETAIIRNNTCLSTSGDGGGIIISSSDNLTLKGNWCSNFAQGIHLNLGDGNLVSGNRIENNTYQGLNIRDSDWNVVKDNTFKMNSQHGIALVTGSSHNMVFNNSLIGNAIVTTYNIDGDRTGTITSQGYDEGRNNFWYILSQSLGNYWSDYLGTGSYFLDGASSSEDLFPSII